MRRVAADHKIDTVFTLLVFCLFAAALLLVLLMGANSYRSVTARTAAAYDQRVCLDYLGAKIRHYDIDGGVFCADFADAEAEAATAEIPTLYLVQEFNGSAYYTRLYLYDGYVRELFADAALEFVPQDGIPVLAADELTFADYHGLIEIYCRVGEQGQWLLIAPRSEMRWADE